MRQLRFFVGTPQRFLLTFCVIGFIVVMANPGMLAQAVSRFVEEASPLVGLAFTIAIMWVGFRLIIGPFLRGKK
ncbi:hypothetical protein HY479_01615 [Candidatus Uhrbacteria bacterium]|nr:hypothetical protein [Candidatus Uhrbacteria bacterium]